MDSYIVPDFSNRSTSLGLTEQLYTAAGCQSNTYKNYWFTELDPATDLMNFYLYYLIYNYVADHWMEIVYKLKTAWTWQSNLVADDYNEVVWSFPMWAATAQVPLNETQILYIVVDWHTDAPKWAI